MRNLLQNERERKKTNVNMNGETRPDISKMAFSEMIRLEGNASLSFFSVTGNRIKLYSANYHSIFTEKR